MSRKTHVNDMGNAASVNGMPSAKSGKPQPTKYDYQQLRNFLSDYKNSKRPLSSEDAAALHKFIFPTLQDEYSQSEKSLTAMKKELSSLQKQRQEILNRISEVAGARLKSNNPAITDLSDQNRPSKLAEKFSELYDNEWTDAAEEMKQVLFAEETTEEERDVAAIKFLYDFTKATYDLCKEKTEEQLRHVKSAVCFKNDSKDLEVEVERKCREFIRKNCEITVCQVVEALPADVVKSLSISEDRKDRLRNCTHANVFFKLCARLCWMMALQDPPICMVTNNDSKEIYRAYTRSGDVVEYVVWPSLLLHEDGPLLYKGIAQFRKKGPSAQSAAEAKPLIDSRKPETPSTESSVYENINVVKKDTNSNNVRNTEGVNEKSTKEVNKKSEGREMTNQPKEQFKTVITVSKSETPSNAQV